MSVFGAHWKSINYIHTAVCKILHHRYTTESYAYGSSKVELGFLYFSLFFPFFFFIVKHTKYSDNFHAYFNCRQFFFFTSSVILAFRRCFFFRFVNEFFRIRNKKFFFFYSIFSCVTKNKQPNISHMAFRRILDLFFFLFLNFQLLTSRRQKQITEKRKKKWW